MHGRLRRSLAAAAWGGGAIPVLLAALGWAPAAPAQELILSEFMASNDSVLADEDGDYEDWIEIQNVSPGTVSLFDWSLTDNADNLTKWQFPATNLPPGGILVVFASNKDRHIPGAPLHTDFKLSAGGEYLALVDPTGTNIVTEFAPAYPGQVQDVSYGFGLVASNVTLAATGAACDVLVPSVANGGSALDYAWTGHATHEPFNTAAWTGGATGIGFGAGDPGDIGLNVQSMMLNQNASAFVRIPFTVSDPSAYALLTLRMRYDDGFAAWVNGVELTRANAPLAGLDWDSAATAAHAASAFESLAFGVDTNLLRSGANILALQGLNVSAGDGSFLVLPELVGTLLAGEADFGVYFTEPTPGAENLGGATILGPGITDVRHTPHLPLENNDLVVTARVFPTVDPVSSVTLHYRVMFDPEVSLTMYDDGAHGDGAAGDGVYGATIPAAASSSSQMVRYRVTAEDDGAVGSRLPVFSDPSSTAEYFGTVIDAGYVSSSLPILQLFAPPSILQPGPTTIQRAADSKAGAKVSVYYDGELYDNVQMQLRGNTTANYDKKSHRLEFNREHPFRYDDDEDRIRKTSFVADFADPTYMRQGLSYRLCTATGADGPFYAPWRLQLNGAFYQLANHNDVHGEELLERLGYDPNGALYNAVGTVQPSISSTGGFEKKTRRWDDNSDYVAFASAINESVPVGDRGIAVFDYMDLPQVISYAVAARLVHENDDVWANMSLYHDNDGDDLWRVIPFDMNLSWGAAYMDHSSYSGIQVDNDNLKSFPLYGGSDSIPANGGNYNRLYDVLYDVPETREMIRRRMRTVLDGWFTPPGTPSSSVPVGQMATAWRDLIGTASHLDRNWWGWPPKGGQCNFDPGIGLAQGVQSLLDDYIGRRRDHLYGKHSVTNTALPTGITKYDNAGIPLAQPADAVVSIAGFDYNPASSNQDEEYVALANTNGYAVDISGWELDGGVRFRFRDGTVIPAGGTLYVSPNTLAFRGRASSPRGGEGRFVVGPYDGRLNAWGESLSLIDATGRLVSVGGFPGQPSAAQRYLRVTEIMYNPSPFLSVTNDEQQFEYIELMNTSTNVTLDLSGVAFTRGIRFDFTGSAVTSLAPGGYVLVVRNPAAFEGRYGTGLPVAGVYDGRLDSNGETLRLEDARGEKILEFTYNNAWHRLSDGLGFSLVTVDDHAPWNRWDDADQWRPSGVRFGTPGAPDPGPLPVPQVRINEALTHTDLPQVDAVELYNPDAAPADVGGWFLTDDIYTPKQYRIPPGTVIAPGGFEVIYESAFNPDPGVPPSFSLSSVGEEVYLFSADAHSNLTGYVHGFRFGAAANGVAFGRHVTSVGEEHFVAQRANSLDGPNAGPKVGPVVISEVMYHPPDPAYGVDNDLDEFIELANITGSAVPLYDPAHPTNTWRLRNAVDYDFPTGAGIPAGSRILVVGFDPADTALLDAFRATYSLDPGVPVYGPWDGKLDNSSDTIELKRPDTPDPGLVPYIQLEELDYRDEAPWPTGPDGLGASLQRLSDTGYGDDPANWFGATPTPGTAGIFNQAPTVALTSPADGVNVHAPTNILLAADAGDADGTVSQVEFRVGGHTLHTDTTAPFSYLWTHPPPGSYELDARAIDNHFEARVSSPRTLHVQTQPPTVTWLSPTGDVVVGVGLPLPLEVGATDPSAAITQVEFFRNGGSLGLDSAAPYTWTFTPAEAGPHELTAVATDVAGGTGTTAVTLVHGVDAISTNLPLIEAGSVWRYRDTGTDPGPTWADPGYSDSGWAGGPAQLGYGDGDEATVVSYGPSAGNKYVTTHFRRTFAADALAGAGDATLHLLRDDGAIVYLNGEEIHRVNMPSGAVTYQTLASDQIYGQGENSFIASPVSLTALQSGTNVLAVEIHQGALDSSDISFDLALEVDLHALAPYVTTDPTDLTLPAGGTGTFAAVVSGTAPFDYQWLKDSSPVPGANGPSLTLTDVTPAEAGSYRLVVSNLAGTALSAAASLTVGLPNDADMDGLPDDWETAHGLSTSSGEGDHGPGGDPDGDGATNAQELAAGTHPKLVASVLKVLSFRPAGLGDQVVLSYPAASNRVTMLQRGPAVDGGDWTTVHVTDSPVSNLTRTVTNSASSPAGTYFRLSVPVAE